MKTSFSTLARAIGGICIILLVANTIAGETGQFANNTDIGQVKHQGSLAYDPASQTYTMTGSGSNMWDNIDELHFAWNKLAGDFIIRAQVKFLGDGVDPHRKIGIHLRQSLDTDSTNVHATVHGDGLTSLQFRAEAGGETSQYPMKIQAPDVIQLERRGNVFIMSAAHFGEPFQVTQASHLTFPDEVYVGLAVCSHNADITETAEFSNVRIIRPADEDFVPYQDYIGSHLEIMDMDTHQRRIVYSSPDSIQAPNWTRDGKTLIFNSKGLLFNFDIATSAVSELNTGFANQNNNDHVLSWDGKHIAISHHAEEEDGRSTIYVLPLTGSDNPRRVTRPGAGHSYLHGFSPDDKKLVFTGQRNNQTDIYTVDIASGEETRITNTPTLDDGPEYSPNGEYIYFNSNRTGTMQLWRADSDGGNPVQLTFDEYNDWFPHISPNGETIVFMSYMSDVESGSHPFYRQVYLRQMPVGGGEPKIIAYLYGGQGTINVPSWSPDGKNIAFVSNTKLPE